MSVSLSPILNGWQSFLANGLPNNFGYINTYLAGSSTPATTYTTSSGIIPNTNPIQLTTGGYTPQEIWLTGGIAYKFVVTDASSNIIATYDNISAFNNASQQIISGSNLVGEITNISATGSATYNSTPNYGKVLDVRHGSTATPTTDGVVSSMYVQRIDESVTTDNSGNLISAIYTVFNRLQGGTGWLYGTYTYLEDHSNTNAAQSVGVAGVIHSITNAQVWGLYSEAHAHTTASTATGIECDAFNNTGTDYNYIAIAPLGVPHSKGGWIFGAGNNRNTIGLGIGSTGSASAGNGMFQAGMYFQTFSCDKYGIDFQCTPQTIINFKYGCSTDGTNTTAGGIGLDCGPSTVAGFGTAINQAAIHLRDQKLGFGKYDGTGWGYIQYDAVNQFLSVYSGGVRAAHLVLSTGVWTPN